MFNKYVDIARESIGYNGTLVVFGIIILLVLFVSDRLFVYTRQRLFDRRVKLYQELLRACPLVLHRNRTDNPVVWAVATSLDYSEALQSLKYPKDLKHGTKPWMPYRVMPKRTYTFVASEQDLRGAHTGTLDSLRQELKSIVETEVLGTSLEWCTQKEVDQILSVLFVDDKRLFVPFAQNNYGEGEMQFQHYGQQDLASFRKALMRDLKRPL